MYVGVVYMYGCKYTLMPFLPTYLPTYIQPLPSNKTPLVALVNSKSGGRQGKNLFKKLRSALSKAQVGR